MAKNKATWIVVDIILTVIVGIMAFNFRNITALGFWIGYAALLIALLMQIVPICLVFGRDIDAVYKILFHTVSIIYFVVQLFISVWALLNIRASIIGVSTFSIAIFLIYICCCIVFYSMFGLREEKNHEM